MADSGKALPPAGPHRVQRAWPWLLLGSWLAIAAGQLWSLQVEAVQKGELCSTAPSQPLWSEGSQR